MKTEIGVFYFCDVHMVAGTDEKDTCCNKRYSMGWYETRKEQESLTV